MSIKNAGKSQFEINQRHDVLIVRNSQCMKDRQRILPDDSPGYALPVIIRNCGTSCWSEDAAIIRNDSRIFAVEIVTDGNLTFVQNGKEYLINPGMVFFIQRGANQIYSTGPAGFVNKLYIGFAGSIIDVVMADLGLNNIDICRLSNTKEIGRYVRRAYTLLAQTETDSFHELSRLAFKTLLLLSRSIEKPACPQQILAAVNYMHSNLSSKISMEDLYHASGLGKSNFFRLWKEHIKNSPVHYLNKIRMTHAAALLTKSGIPIKEIAYKVGCPHLQYFSRLFKMEIGISPRAYRKKNSVVLETDKHFDFQKGCFLPEFPL